MPDQVRHEGGLGGCRATESRGVCRDKGKDQVPGWRQVSDEASMETIAMTSWTRMSGQTNTRIPLQPPWTAGATPRSVTPAPEPGSSRRTSVSRKNLSLRANESPTRWTSRDWMPDQARHDGEWGGCRNKDPVRPFGAASPQGRGIGWDGVCARQVASAEKGLSGRGGMEEPGSRRTGNRRTGDWRK
jgi:hypothetical protein